MKSNLILIIILAFFIYDFLNKKQNKDSTRIKTITPEKNKRIKENFSDTYDKYISKETNIVKFLYDNNLFAPYGKKWKNTYSDYLDIIFKKKGKINKKLEYYQIIYDWVLLQFYNYQNEQKQYTSNSIYFEVLKALRDLLFMMLKNKDKEIKDKDKKIKKYCKRNFTPPPQAEVAGAVGLNDKLESYQILYDLLFMMLKDKDNEINKKLEYYQYIYDRVLLKFYNYQNEQKKYTSESIYFEVLKALRDLLFMMLKDKDKEIKDKDKKIKEYCKGNFPPPRAEIAGAVGFTMGMSKAEREKLIKDYQRQQNYITSLIYK